MYLFIHLFTYTLTHSKKRTWVDLQQKHHNMIKYKLKRKKLYQGKDKLEEWVMTWKKIKEMYSVRDYTVAIIYFWASLKQRQKEEMDSYLVLII